MAEEFRIAIQYKTTDVPGLPADRAQRVANDFALWKLSRQFSYKQDYIHCSSEFDSDVPKAVWILCDFNVRDRRTDINKIPTQFWKVDYGNIRSA
jgi:hypothetical protein